MPPFFVNRDLGVDRSQAVASNDRRYRKHDKRISYIRSVQSTRLSNFRPSLRAEYVNTLLTPLVNIVNVFCVSALSGLANSTAGMSLCTCRLAWYSINDY